MQADHLDAVLEPLGKRVRGFYGAQGSGSLPKDTSVAVCTIEKANSLVNKLLDEGRLSELAIIVIDELHMVSVIVAIFLSPVKACALLGSMPPIIFYIFPAFLKLFLVRRMNFSFRHYVQYTLVCSLSLY